MNNIDAIYSNGHEVSFEVLENSEGNSLIKVFSDRTAKILTVEIDKLGKLVHSLEKGLKGTTLETKNVLNVHATKETGPLKCGNDKVGTFERYEQKGKFGGHVIKNVSNFGDDLQVEEEIKTLNENETNYTKTVNGVTAFSMTKTSDGIVLTRYDRAGNVLKTYSYDKNGKPIGNEKMNFPAVPGYEPLNSIDMNNPYVFEDLMQNDFIQDIGIPIEMRETVKNVEQTRYKEMPMVRDAKVVINQMNRTRILNKCKEGNER